MTYDGTWGKFQVHCSIPSHGNPILMDQSIRRVKAKKYILWYDWTSYCRPFCITCFLILGSMAIWLCRFLGRRRKLTWRFARPFRIWQEECKYVFCSTWTTRQFY